MNNKSKNRKVRLHQTKTLLHSPHWTCYKLNQRYSINSTFLNCFRQGQRNIIQHLDKESCRQFHTRDLLCWIRIRSVCHSFPDLILRNIWGVGGKGIYRNLYRDFYTYRESWNRMVNARGWEDKKMGESLINRLKYLNYSRQIISRYLMYNIVPIINNIV